MAIHFLAHHACTCNHKEWGAGLCYTYIQIWLTVVVLMPLQTGMPMTALSVLGGQFRLKSETRAELFRDFLPWALRAGFRSADLMCLYYEKHFEVTLCTIIWQISLIETQYSLTVLY